MSDQSQQLYDQLQYISKASAYDVVSKQNELLEQKNKLLTARVKFLEDLISEYTGKMLDNLNNIQP